MRPCVRSTAGLSGSAPSAELDIHLSASVLELYCG